MDQENDQPTDARLLTRLATDDATALDALLARYWPPLTAFLTRMTGSAEAAEDAVTETFCRVWEQRHHWQPSGPARELLFRLARSIAMSTHREARLAEQRPVPFDGRRSLVPADPATGGAADAALEHAIATLSPRRREVFLLRAVHELSYEEIAAIMGTSSQTVANQLSHALAALRRDLSDGVVDPEADPDAASMDHA